MDLVRRRHHLKELLSILGIVSVFLAQAPTAFSKMGQTQDCPKPGSDTGPSVFEFSSKKPHKVQILDDGLAELELKIRMIEEAKESIDIHIYDFARDTTGKIIMTKLLQKTQQNPKFKARIIIDTLAEGHKPWISGDMADAIAKATTRTVGGEPQLQIRYFNPTPMLMFWRAHVRDHNKTIIKDGGREDGEFITGGRNIKDSYHGLDPKHNYIDRGIWMKGEGARAQRDVFNEFWNSERVRKPNFVTRSRISKKDWTDFFDTQTPGFQEKLRVIRKAGSDSLGKVPVSTVSDITLVSDGPGTKKSDRRTGARYIEAFSQAKDRVVIENYIYMPTKKMAQTRDELIKKGVPIKVLTNSFDSADFRFVQIYAHHRQKQAVKQGVAIKGMDGTPNAEQTLLDPKLAQQAWTDHSKVMVADNAVAIGTFNMDPRSERINVESGVIIRDQRLADSMARSIEDRGNGKPMLGSDGRYYPVDTLDTRIDPAKIEGIVPGRGKTLFQYIKDSVVHVVPIAGLL